MLKKKSVISIVLVIVSLLAVVFAFIFLKNRNVIYIDFGRATKEVDYIEFNLEKNTFFNSPKVFQYNNDKVGVFNPIKNEVYIYDFLFGYKETIYLEVKDGFVSGITSDGKDRIVFSVQKNVDFSRLDDSEYIVDRSSLNSWFLYENGKQVNLKIDVYYPSGDIYFYDNKNIYLGGGKFGTLDGGNIIYNNLLKIKNIYNLHFENKPNFDINTGSKYTDIVVKNNNGDEFIMNGLDDELKKCTPFYLDKDSFYCYVFNDDNSIFSYSIFSHNKDGEKKLYENIFNFNIFNESIYMLQLDEEKKQWIVRKID